MWFKYSLTTAVAYLLQLFVIIFRQINTIASPAHALIFSVEYVPTVSNPFCNRHLVVAFILYWKYIIEFCGFEMCCVDLFWNALKARRYCIALWCNPWYLVCSLKAAEVKSWTWCWPSLERGLSSEVRRRPNAQGGYSQVPLSLPHVHRSSPRPPSPPTRKQLASVIRCCTYFHNFISSGLFVCFAVMTKVLCPPCRDAVNHNYISSRCKELEREGRRKRLSGALCASLQGVEFQMER